MPTDANLLSGYESFEELEEACAEFMDDVNSRVHRSTLEIPAQMLALAEAARLHAVPQTPMTASFGLMRKVPVNTPMITFEHARYSVPHTLMGARVWVRRDGERVVVVHVGADGPIEVARHPVTLPGVSAVIDAHFPPAPSGALERKVKATNTAEAEFLAIGEGAALWLKEAAAAGTGKIRHKMERAVALSKMIGDAEVDQGLGVAAVHQRFRYEDLVSIVNNTDTTAPGPRTVTDPDRLLSQGTSGWASFGVIDDDAADTDRPVQAGGDTK